jgi:isoquinoline 1-oxidoreductase subunit beta
MRGCRRSNGQDDQSRHEVVHTPSGKKIGYGDVAEVAAGLAMPGLDTLNLKDPSAFRYIGKGNVTIVDLFDITTGKADRRLRFQHRHHGPH